MDKIVLTMDVGNTNMKFGLWIGHRMEHTWRVNTRQNPSGDELGLMMEGFLRLQSIKISEVADLVVSNVVLPMRPPIERLGTRYLGKAPVIVEAFNQKIMPVKYDDPRQVGADRVIGAIAAYDRFQTSLVVVDFGTATTFDCISQAGEYLGGAIAPGFRLSAEALFDRARRLPRMEQFSRPVKAIGVNTLDSLNSGLVMGYAGLVEGMIARIKLEMGSIKVVATGGLAALIAGEAPVIEEILPDLTMEGLKIVYDRGAW
ncbi:MAG: type III pantothenate kinase [Deltaproteobacteria bacterium]|jgi:type III pantothenate kinase|nr:type III pantothenate kinase [Deltaproteobacteria bacterium]